MWLPLVRPLLGTWPESQAHALTGNRTSDPLVQRPGAQSTKPHQHGLKKLNFKYFVRNHLVATHPVLWSAEIRTSLHTPFSSSAGPSPGWSPCCASPAKRTVTACPARQGPLRSCVFSLSLTRLTARKAALPCS